MIFYKYWILTLDISACSACSRWSCRWLCSDLQSIDWKATLLALQSAPIWSNPFWRWWKMLKDVERCWKSRKRCPTQPILIMTHRFSSYMANINRTSDRFPGQLPFRKRRLSNPSEWDLKCQANVEPSMWQKRLIHRWKVVRYGQIHKLEGKLEGNQMTKYPEVSIWSPIEIIEWRSPWQWLSFGDQLRLSGHICGTGSFRECIRSHGMWLASAALLADHLGTAQRVLRNASCVRPRRSATDLRCADVSLHPRGYGWLRLATAYSAFFFLEIIDIHILSYIIIYNHI